MPIILVVELAMVEVCTVVGKSDVKKSDLDGKESTEELVNEGNDIDNGEPASGENESGERKSREIAEEPVAEGNSVDAVELAVAEPAAAERKTTVQVLHSLGAARFKHSPA